MTDEELENIKLLPCPSCDSTMTSVRRVSDEWWYVGCVDCFNKTQCQREFVEGLAERWNKYARKCGK